jgi:hypothetical protein
MIGTTQSICGCLGVSNSAQSLRRRGRRDLGLPVSGDALPLQIQGNTAAVASSKVKRPSTLVDVIRRETMQLSMPLER